MSESEPAIHQQIDAANYLVRVSLKGAVTLLQVEEYMQELDRDPAYRLDFDALVDLRDFTGELNRESLRQLAGAVRANPGSPGARRAIIVASDLHYGMIRTLEAFTSLAPVVYRVFRSEDAAMAWLAERRRPARS